MLKKLTLINFMSHQETIIEFSEGLTVISGENNCGKSAIVSALQCVCSNATGHYMVRHGEKECRVIVETDDGHVVEWKRTNRKVSYVVNGETIDRTHGKVPEKVEQVLRMGKVEAENQEFDVHFADQKKPVFLLDGTAAQRAAFFASSSDAAKLIEMQSLHKSKLADAQRQVRESQQRETDLLARIEKLNPVDSIKTEMEIAGQLESELGLLDVTINQLSETISAIGQAHRQKKHCSQLTKSLEPLGTSPDFKDTSTLELILEQLNQATLLQQQNSKTLQSLDNLPSPPEFTETRGLEKLIQNLSETLQKIAVGQATTRTLDLPDVPVFLMQEGELKTGQALIEDLKRQKREIERLKKTLLQIPILNPLEEDPKAETLAKLIVAQTQSQEDFESLEKESQQIVRQAESVHRELHRALDESGTCPTCGQETHLTRTNQ